MTKLTGLTGTAVEDATIPGTDSGPSNTQSQKGFWRRIRHAQGGIYMESSAGGQIFIPVSELWALAEKSDANLIAPKIT